MFMKAVIDILQREVPYLNSSRNKALLVAFLAVFTLIFLVVYNPFNMIEWGGSILGYVGIGTVVMLVSQFPLRNILGVRKFRLYHLFIWIIGELFVITFFVYLVYGPLFPTFKERVHEYLETLKFVCLIIIGPYFLFVWFLAYRHKLSNYQDVARYNASIDPGIDNKLLTIIAENNKTVLAINSNHLLFVRSSGNYVDIYYLKGDILSKELVRMSLKGIEVKLKGSSVLRVHRSYMVNTNMISSFKKTRKGYNIRVQHASEEIIPVSLGYKDQFEEALGLNVPH